MARSPIPSDELRDAIARWLDPSRLRGPAGGVRARVELEFQGFTAVQYSYYLDGEFADSLIYLPNALDLMAAEGNDYGLVACRVANFVLLWERDLALAGLLSLVAECLRAVVFSWSETFPLQDDAVATSTDPSTPLLSIGGEPAIDAFFDSLLAGSPQGSTDSVDEGELFKGLFCKWDSNFSSPPHSANVIAFYLRVRFFPTTLKLYRDKLVLSKAFDECLLRSHWRIAGGLVRERCSASYVTVVKDVLDVEQADG
jgi:hypothetical protein